MHFSNLPASLLVNLYFFLIQTPQELHPLAVVFHLEEHVFQKNLILEINSIGLVRVISCEPVRVETETMNFSEDSIFYKLFIW